MTEEERNVMIGERHYQTLKCMLLGRLFVRAQELGYDPDIFVDAFMQSPTADILDEAYSAYDGRSVVYLIEEAVDLMNIDNPEIKPKYDNAILNWVGNTYRTWNQITDESSAEIQKQAPFKVMVENYQYCTNMSYRHAVDYIREELGGGST